MVSVQIAERAAANASTCTHPRCATCDIRRVAVCAAVGPEHLSRLSAIASEQSLAPGRLLFEEGEPAEAVYVVTAGMLKLYKLLSDGRRQILGFVVPGDFLGCAFGRLHVCSAEAVTAVELCRLRRARFLTLLDDCPSLEKEIMRRTCTELAAAQEQMLVLGRKTATERVASFILRMSERRRPANDSPLQLPMSRADIADYLGLTVETVSRTLSSLRKSGAIDLLDKHLVAIRRRRQLEQSAGA